MVPLGSAFFDQPDSGRLSIAGTFYHPVNRTFGTICFANYVRFARRWRKAETGDQRSKEAGLPQADSNDERNGKPPRKRVEK